MQEKQIIDEIIRYLKDENYRYAVLIDGNWGCGKTYFVLHDLKESIEKNDERNIKYISLYGCNSIEEIEKNIYWSIIDKAFFDLQNKLKGAVSINPVYGEVAEKRKKHQRILTTATKKIIGTAMQNFEIAGKDFEVVSEIVTLDKNIFIFDDLERCNCSINDILGYINGLVEHEGVKIILIANESEIGQLRKREYRELQNLVAAQSNILIPKSPVLGRKEKTDIPKEFSLVELERRRREIFREEVWDEQYKRIREKLIGITIHYKPDIATILHHLLNGFKGKHDLKKRLENHVQFFINTMHENKHFNFRTFQFFLSKIEYIYVKIDQNCIGGRYKEKVLDFIVKNCFEACIEYKASIGGQSRKRVEEIFYDKKLRIQSIKIYVQTSVLEIEALRNEIDQFVKEELFEKLDAEDPLNQLRNRWYLESQTWVESRIADILERLENGAYHENSYREILLILMRLETIGFSGESLKQAVAYIKSDLRKKGKKLSEEWYLVKKENFADRYKKLITDLNQELEDMKNPMEDIEKILKNDKEWGKLLNDYTEKCKTERHLRSGFLQGIDARKWVQRIKESNPENLFWFRNFLKVALPNNVVRKGIKEDMPTVNMILEGLGDGNDEKDLIKRQAIKWVIRDLEEAKQRFIGIYAKDYEQL